MLDFNVSDIVLPKPSQIIVTLVERMPALWPHALQTLYTTLIGFGFGIIIGISLGVLVGSSRLAYDVAYPLLIGFATDTQSRRGANLRAVVWLRARCRRSSRR